MPISQTDQLFRLVKSLSKAEKRSFRLYATRSQGEQDALFLQLFDVLDKQAAYDEKALFKKLQGVIDKRQFPNLKRHLYQQVLTSLRLIYMQKQLDIQIRELLDYAHILYGKGLYLQALKILDKAKKKARGTHQDLLHLEIVEFEKLIESRHITRSGPERNKSLADEAAQRSTIIAQTTRFSNLKQRLHSLYISLGHVKNEEDQKQVEVFFKKHLPTYDEERMTFFEKIYLYFSYVWYYYILLDFENCGRYAEKWTSLFQSQPTMIAKDPDLYMRGLHYQMTAAFNTSNHPVLVETLQQLTDFLNDSRHTFNPISHITAFQYQAMGLINKHFLEGSFSEGVQLLPHLLDQLEEKYRPYLDSHKVLVFYYKMAWMYIGNNQPDEAIGLLLKIIDLKAGQLREDIQGYARLLTMLAHYELHNYELLEYLVNSTTRFLAKVQDLNPVQLEILNLFKKVVRSYSPLQREVLELHYQRLTLLAANPYEKRSFIYLDILPWIESKLQGKNLQEVAQERFQVTVV